MLSKTSVRSVVSPMLNFLSSTVYKIPAGAPLGLLLGFVFLGIVSSAAGGVVETSAFYLALASIFGLLFLSFVWPFSAAARLATIAPHYVTGSTITRWLALTCLVVTPVFLVLGIWSFYNQGETVEHILGVLSYLHAILFLSINVVFLTSLHREEARLGAGSYPLLIDLFALCMPPIGNIWFSHRLSRVESIQSA